MKYARNIRASEISSCNGLLRNHEDAPEGRSSECGGRGGGCRVELVDRGGCELELTGGGELGAWGGLSGSSVHVKGVH